MLNRQRYRGRSGSPPELRIDSALLCQCGLESRCFLGGPGSSEVIEVVPELAAGGRLPCGLLQHAENRFVETQTVRARALPDDLLKLRRDVAQGDGGHRMLLGSFSEQGASYHSGSSSRAVIRYSALR